MVNGYNKQVTGEPLIQRSDDNEKVLQKRLETYHRDTTPVLDYYQKKGILSSIDASKSCDEVYSDIKSVLLKTKQKL